MKSVWFDNHIDFIWLCITSFSKPNAEQMSNSFTYFTVSLPFSSRDVSTAISNLFQTTTARWRHGSHSTQTYHSGVCPPRPRPRWPFRRSGDHLRFVRVDNGPRLDSCCLCFVFYPYRFFDTSCSPVRVPVYDVILLSHVICDS